MKRIVKILCAALMCTQLTSCASVINGKHQKVMISSNPIGADIYVDGELVGQTPAEVKIRRNRDHIVTIRKEGFGQEEVVLSHVFSGAVAGNLIAGGFIGWGVDAMTGAQYRLVPETVSVRLEEATEANVAKARQADSLTLDEKIQRLHDLLEQGLITQDQHDAMTIALELEKNQAA